MEIINKKDPVEKIEDLNRKGKIKTLSLKKDPRTPRVKSPWNRWPEDKERWDRNWEKIFGRR